MNEFKIGDKVVCVDVSESGDALNIGGLYTITQIESVGKCQIVWLNTQKKYGFRSDHFTLAESSPTFDVGTVTKIIHNGVTTVTQFSDNSKMVTRPSEDGEGKYDPYVGWCVGVTAKLFGGKVAAKKFYKAHAVVQREVGFAPAPSKTAFEAFAIAIGAMSKLGHTIKAEIPVPVEQPEPSKPIAECRNCQYVDVRPLEEPCKVCRNNYVFKWAKKEE